MNDDHKKLIDRTRALLENPEVGANICLTYSQPHDLVQLKRLAGDAVIRSRTESINFAYFEFSSEHEAEVVVEA